MSTTTTALSPCAECGRNMRPRNTRIADHPGTVGHHAGGICTACHRRHVAAGETDHSPSPEVVIENIQFLLEHDEHPDRIATRIGDTDRHTLAQFLRRHDRRDLARVFDRKE